MWDVYETKDVTKRLKKIPPAIKEKYKAWIEIVKNGGSGNLKNYPGLKDEKLQGKLQGCRSSRLNLQYRVIYSEDAKSKEIIVLSVTPHDYSEV